MYKCFYCGHEIIWNSDADAEDLYDNEDVKGRVVSFFTCPHCAAEYEVIQPESIPDN